MIYRNIYGTICEMKKTDFPNDDIYYTKIYENMVKIAKSEESFISKKTLQNKNKKQTNKQKENITTSNIHI